MAIQGKKINELDSITTVSDATVFPAVYVEGSITSSTANKVSISQLKENLQQDIYTKEQVETLIGQKQDILTPGTNITIEEDSDENLVISAEAGDALPSQTGNNGKFLTTNGISASWATLSGLQNTATGTSSLTILGTASNNTGTVNIGDSSIVVAGQSTAIGLGARTGQNGVAVGQGAGLWSTSTYTFTTAVGSNSQNYGDNSTAVGKGANAAQDTVAIGTSAGDTAAKKSVFIGSSTGGSSNAVAVGYSARANASYSIQIGQGTNSTANTLSIGLSDSNNYQLLDSAGKIPLARLPIVQCTQAEYDALVSGGTVDANTLYLIVEESN